MLKLSHELTDTIQRVHGERGRQWLSMLPALLSECRERWSLELNEPFENLSYNLVIPGRMRDSTEIVLKVGVPCSELLTEAAALGLFDADGAVRLIDADAPRGILLMERVAPGTPLYKLQDDAEATRTAAQLMRRLWRLATEEHAFPSLGRWFGAFERLRNEFNGGSGPFPPELIARAEQMFIELNASSNRKVVLHGDLHHYNILSSSRHGWLAIDPKGIIGATGYEVGPFMLNQLPHDASDSTLAEILDRRLSIFSEELGVRKERLAQWTFCHAVLSAVWDYEEKAEWHRTIRVAQMLKGLE